MNHHHLDRGHCRSSSHPTIDGATAHDQPQDHPRQSFDHHQATLGIGYADKMDEECFLGQVVHTCCCWHTTLSHDLLHLVVLSGRLDNSNDSLRCLFDLYFVGDYCLSLRLIVTFGKHWLMMIVQCLEYLIHFGCVMKYFEHVGLTHFGFIAS